MKITTHSITTPSRFIASMAMIFICNSISYSQSAEMDSLTYHAYLGSKDYDSVIQMWKKAIEAKEEALAKEPKNSRLRYEIVLAQFGMLNATLRKKDEDLFDAHVDEAEKNLKSLIDDQKKRGEPRALLSSLYGLKLAYSPWKGMYYGPKSSGLMEEALRLNPNTPLVQKLYGNSKFFTPEAFGGDVAEAIAAYEKAIALYEKHHYTKHNWFYLDAIVFLGQAYSRSGNHAKAIATYEKVLSIEPEHGWVKYELLPKERKHR